MTAPEARSREQRRVDVLHRLEDDIDAWVATADPAAGTPYLVPLSFWWDGEALWLSTATATPTSRNLAATGTVRLGLGLTRDVVLVEGAVEVVADTDVSAAVGDAFAVKTGFDPRALPASYSYFRVRPALIQAWREVNELPRRDLMRAGRWFDAPPYAEA